MKNPLFLLPAAQLLFIQESPIATAQTQDVALDDQCSGTDLRGNCADEHANCTNPGTGTKVCKCATDYVAEGTACKIKAGASVGVDCTGGSLGTCVANSTCTGTKCVCTAATHEVNTANGTCRLKAGTGAAKTSSTTASTTTPAPGKVGGTCSGTGKGDCTDEHAECTGENGSKTCTCVKGYKREGGACTENAGGRIYGNWAFLILATAFARFLLR